MRRGREGAATGAESRSRRQPARSYVCRIGPKTQRGKEAIVTGQTMYTLHRNSGTAASPRLRSRAPPSLSSVGSNPRVELAARRERSRDAPIPHDPACGSEANICSENP